MCGMCGIVGTIDQGVIERMTASLAHRGPDGSGVEIFPESGFEHNLALGHRRLVAQVADRIGAALQALAAGRNADCAAPSAPPA